MVTLNHQTNTSSLDGISSLFHNINPLKYQAGLHNSSGQRAGGHRSLRRRTCWQALCRLFRRQGLRLIGYLALLSSCSRNRTHSHSLWLKKQGTVWKPSPYNLLLLIWLETTFIFHVLESKAFLSLYTEWRLDILYTQSGGWIMRKTVGMAKLILVTTANCGLLRTSRSSGLV